MARPYGIVLCNMQHFKSWYDRRYPALSGHGLWLRGGELNTLPSTHYDQRGFRVLLTRMSTYVDTAASFTHLLLYQLAARMEGVFPDLAYLPPRSDAAIFERDEVPWLLGTQTKRGPLDFDWIAFSNSITQELINLPSFLRTSGIPFRKSERLARPELPLLILGGANALYTTALWAPDVLGGPLVDGVFVGESDAAIRRLLEIGRDAKKAGASKSETLAELGKVDGFLIPDAPQRTKKASVSQLQDSEALTSAPVPYVEERIGAASLQISEGCPCFCTFCAESWDRKPYRERRLDSVMQTALAAKAAMGLDQVDLYSFNFNMHSDFYALLWELVPQFKSIGLKSQRFDLLAHDPMMTEFQHAVEKASFTCGLEGISPRLRRYLRKNLEDAELAQALGSIFKSKAREVKVFLIATGIEDEADLAAFDAFLAQLKQLRVTHRSSARMIFSMTPLVRFPWTPMEFEEAPSMARVREIIAKTAGRVRQAGFEFREAADLPEYWVSQVLVRARDARVGEAICEAVAKTGFVYYREVSEAFRKEFEAALAARGLAEGELFAGGAGPWEIVETGIRREFLRETLQEAKNFEEGDYCLGRYGEVGHCFRCGGCPTRFHVRDIVLAKQERKVSLDDFKARIKEARADEAIVSLHVDAGSSARGLPRAMLGAAVARAMMLSEEALVAGYRGFKGSYWNEGGAPVWIIGAERIDLLWRKGALSRVGSLLGTAEFLERVNRELGEWGTVLGVAPEGFRPRKLMVEGEGFLDPDHYLKKRDLKHTLRKNPDGSYLCELAPQARKKGILGDLVIQNRGPGARAELELGPKFSAAEWVELAKLSLLPRGSANDWPKVLARALV